MSLEEANKIVTMSIFYDPNGWYWVIDTHTPYGKIIGDNKYPIAGGAALELKYFLRYFTKNVLKNGDTIRAYVEKHKPKDEEDFKLDLSELNNKKDDD